MRVSRVSIYPLRISRASIYPLNRFARLALLALVPAVACGGAGRSSMQAPGQPPTSGGEQDPGAPGLVSPTDQQYDGYDPKKDRSGSDKVAAAPAKKAAKYAEAKSAWGAPETETGRKLPPRQKISAQAKKHLDTGLQEARAFRTLQAEKAFRKAYELDRKAYQAAYNVGVMLDRGGNERAALDWYRRSLSIQFDYEKAAEGIVNIYLRRGSGRQAWSFIEPLAKRWERNLYLQALYADVLAENNRLDQADEAARKALKRDERFVPAMISLIKTSLRRGRNELAESILKQALEVDGEGAELHFLQGQIYEEQERTADALKSYEQAVRFRPEYAEARMALGIQYLAGGNYQQALSQFQKVAKMLPNSAAVHLNLGDAYRATKQWQKAKSALEKALKLDRNLPEAHFNMGLMYMAAGDQFPGLDKIKAYTYAINEFTSYRSQMGSKLARDDISTSYLEDLKRSIERENKRIEREKARKQREKERAARAAEMAKEQ